MSNAVNSLTAVVASDFTSSPSTTSPSNSSSIVLSNATSTSASSSSTSSNSTTTTTNFVSSAANLTNSSANSSASSSASSPTPVAASALSDEPTSQLINAGACLVTNSGPSSNPSSSSSSSSSSSHILANNGTTAASPSSSASSNSDLASSSSSLSLGSHTSMNASSNAAASNSASSSLLASTAAVNSVNSNGVLGLANQSASFQLQAGQQMQHQAAAAAAAAAAQHHAQSFHQQQIPHHINLSHLNHHQLHHQPQLSGIQYFQYPSNTTPTTPVNPSPLSSLTSSPSTTNATSFQFHHTSPHNHSFHSAAGLGGHHATSALQTSLLQHHQSAAAAQHAQPQQFQSFHAFHPNFKDTRWLTLEVCREHQRNKCNRTENECKFAHPPPHVEIVNGKVIACYDSLKGKCSRKEPPCKYLHPPQHLKDQLLQNGKNNLVLRQVALAMMQQQQQQAIPGASSASASQAATAAMIAAVNNAAIAAAVNGQSGQPSTASPTATSNSNLTTSSTPNTGANTSAAQYAAYTSSPAGNGNPSAGATQIIPTLSNNGLTTYSSVQLANQPTFLLASNGYHSATGHQSAASHLQPTLYDPTTTALLQQVAAASALSPGAVAATANGLIPPQQRTDRLQICRDFQSGNCSKQPSECAFAHPPSHCPVDTENSLVTVCVDFIKGKCSRETCKYFHPPEHLVAQLKKQKITNNQAAAAATAAFANSLAFLPASIAGNAYGIGQLGATSHYMPSNSGGGYRSHGYRSGSSSHHHTTPSHSPIIAHPSQIVANGGLQYALQQQQQLQDQSLLQAAIEYNQQQLLKSSSNRSTNNHHALNHASAVAALIGSSNTPSANYPAQFSATALSALPTAGSNLTQSAGLNNSNLALLFDNGQSFQIPSFHTTVYQRAAQNGNAALAAAAAAQLNGSANDDVARLTSHQNELNKAASASATANNAVNANVVDVVPNKKRPHDAIEQDFIPMTANLYQAASLPVKRPALTDSKTGLPVFQSYNHQAAAGVAAAGNYQHLPQHLSMGSTAGALLNYQPINFALPPYASYQPAFSLQYNGHPNGLPRL